MTVDIKKLEERVHEIEFAMGKAGVPIPAMSLTASYVCGYAWPVNSVIFTATNENPLAFGNWELIGDVKVNQPNVLAYAWKRIS